jgi:hypothetical protein
MPRFIQSFTVRLSIFILVIAFLAASTIYDKEVLSVERIHANACSMTNTCGMVKYTLTAEEAAHFREAAYWYFVIFSLPLISLFICSGRKSCQVAIAIFSVAMLMLALSVSPGGDRKGCDECFAPVFLSIVSTILSSILFYGSQPHRFSNL